MVGQHCLLITKQDEINGNSQPCFMASPRSTYIMKNYYPEANRFYSCLLSCQLNKIT